MKIAHIVCTFPPYQGGMGNSVWRFSTALLPYRHQLTVFTPHYGRQTPAPNKEILDGLQVERLASWLVIGNAAIMRGLGKRLKEFDVIHLHYPFFGTAEIVAWKKLIRGRRLKLIVHYHMDCHAGGLKGLIFQLYRWLFLPLLVRLADEVTCASLDYIKHSALAAYYRRRPEKFRQVPFGVDLEKFKPAAAAAGKNILFVGGLDRAHCFKGVDKLLAAFKIVNSRLPEASLTIVGKGEMEDEYRDLAERLGLTTKVEFINDADDRELINHYQHSALLVLPSLNQSEAFGLVLLEAMACGKPVVASKLPGVRGVFKNGRQGLLVKPGEVEDLAKKILTILLDAALEAKMGRAARALVEKYYSWDKAAEGLNEIYYRIRYAPKKI